LDEFLKILQTVIFFEDIKNQFLVVERPKKIMFLYHLMIDYLHLLNSHFGLESVVHNYKVIQKLD
jgi:hypothetical protein